MGKQSSHFLPNIASAVEDSKSILLLNTISQIALSAEGGFWSNSTLRMESSLIQDASATVSIMEDISCRVGVFYFYIPLQERKTVLHFLIMDLMRDKYCSKNFLGNFLIIQNPGEDLALFSFPFYERNTDNFLRPPWL